MGLTSIYNSLSYIFSYLSSWYFTGIFIAGYIPYYFIEVAKVPLLACSDGNFKNFLLNNIPELQEKFYPTIWCSESRAQTILASCFRNVLVSRIKYRRYLLSLSDGGQVALDWQTDGCQQNSPIVILLPGLTGDSQADYIRILVSSLNKSGIRCVVFINRGLGGVSLKTPRAYCASNVEDLAEVVRHVRQKHPGVPLALSGVSMGGLLVGNYLSTRPDEANEMIVAAMLISPPWNVLVGTDSIELPGINSLLNRHLASGLCSTFRKNKDLFKSVVDPDTVMSSRTVRQFDSTFTVKMFGYKDVVDYYKHATIHDKIHLIQVPTLCLSASDDPFQPMEGIPIDAASNSKHVAILVTSRGGHIGFMEGLFPLDRQGYMGRLFGQYFKSVFTNDEYKLLGKKL